MLKTMKSHSGQLDSITVRNQPDGSGGVYIYQYEIDDQALVDAATDGQAVVTYGPVTGTATFVLTIIQTLLL